MYPPPLLITCCAFHPISTFEHARYPNALYPQINALRGEVAERTQIQQRMHSDILNLERNNAMLLSDNGMLQQRAAQGEAAERDLRQTQWRVDAMEQELRGAAATIEHQQQALRRAGQISAATAAHAVNIPPPLPPSQSQATAAVSQYQPPAMLPTNPHSAYSYQGGGGSIDNSLGSNSIISSGNRSLASLVGNKGPPAQSCDSTGGSGFSGENRSGQSSANQQRPIVSHASHSTQQPSAISPASSARASRGSGVGNESSSLASLLHSRNRGDGDHPSGTGWASGGGGGAGIPIVGKSPFANEWTSAQLTGRFDDLDRQLTALMREKTSLSEEGERSVSLG